MTVDEVLRDANPSAPADQRERVHLIDELIWSFRDDGKPRMKTGPGYGTTVDPTPGYPHDVDLVVDQLQHVECYVDVAHKPAIYVLTHEPFERTNGWATVNARYQCRDEDCTDPTCARPGGPKWDGIIILAGKRIPLHPGMTRYLVAHEYGHHVEYDLLHRRGLESHDSAVRDEYARLRGCRTDLPYGPGNWHASPGELLANDFRILVAGVEPEFWPHPGFTRPEATPGLESWWRAQL